jgi:hypothetical protein
MSRPHFVQTLICAGRIVVCTPLSFCAKVKQCVRLCWPLSLVVGVCEKMNAMMKAAVRFSAIKNISNPLKQALLPGNTVAGATRHQFTRTLWHMCSTKSENSKVSNLKLKNPTTVCSCGCGSQRLQHTKSKYVW